MKIPLFLPAILLVFSIVGCGNQANDWAPGQHDSKGDETTLPIPGLGTTSFKGERDTKLEIHNMTWQPGAAGPGAELIVLDRSASGPLNTRGDNQRAIETMRFAQLERILDRTERVLAQAVSLAQPYIPAPRPAQPPAEPDQADLKSLIKQMIADAIKERG